MRSMAACGRRMGGRFITLRDPDNYRLFFVTWDAGQALQTEKLILLEFAAQKSGAGPPS